MKLLNTEKLNITKPSNDDQTFHILNDDYFNADDKKKSLSNLKKYF